MNKMEPPLPPVLEPEVESVAVEAELDGGIMYFAAACAQRKEPVMLISTTRLNSLAVASREGTQPTTPAKQQRMFMLPRAA